MSEELGGDLSRKIDLLAKATAIALTVLYILGYLVVSLYLAEFGIHSVELLRIQYLTAGFFSLGPLFLIYFLWTLSRLGFEKLFLGEIRIGSPPASIWPRIRWVLVALLRIAWELQSVVTCFGTVTFFALWLYPALPSAYLGGVPVPITFQFAEKSMPVANSAQLKGWLLDETDDGFYFIQDKNSKKAVFIPRSDVTAAYYGEQK